MNLESEDPVPLGTLVTNMREYTCAMLWNIICAHIKTSTPAEWNRWAGDLRTRCGNDPATLTHMRKCLYEVMIKL